MKKKLRKYSILNFYIILLNILFFSLSANAEERCIEYFSTLKSDYAKYKPEVSPKYEFNDFGFRLKSQWNPVKDQWEYHKDKDGFYSVGQITSLKLYGKISSGDKIISYNGKNLQSLKLKDDENFSDNFEDNETVNFVFLNKDSYNLSLKKEKYELMDPYADFYIRSLIIDEENEKIETRIYLEAADEISADEQMYVLAKELLFDIEEGEVKDTYGCFYDTSNWNDANFANPASGFEFVNLHSTNYDTYSTSIYVKPYTTQVEWMKDYGWNDVLYVEYSEDGVHKFNTDFKYHNFPFDKQTIVFKLVSGLDMGDSTLSLSDFSKKSLIAFQNLNNISGWDITANRLVFGSIKKPLNIHPNATVSLELDIERKSGYYIYKVILPIVIILVICWASLWISPKELESKLTITIVCLLSLIAYNFIIDGEIPKLEYLTIIDWIILASYFYAALPNLLGIYFNNLYTKNEKKRLIKFENFAKRYGLLSYLLIVFLIIILNVSVNSENASAMFAWMSAR